MTPRIRVACLLLAAMAAAAGCSSSTTPAAQGGNASSSSAAVTASRSSAAPATPSTWTAAQAQSKYLALVKPGNHDLATLNQLISTQPQDIAPWTSICRKLVDDEDKFARGLSAGLWSARVQPKVDALIDALTKERSAYQTCAAAKSLNVVSSALDQIAAASSAAETVRIALGLPGTTEPS